VLATLLNIKQVGVVSGGIYLLLQYDSVAYPDFNSGTIFLPLSIPSLTLNQLQGLANTIISFSAAYFNQNTRFDTF